VAKLKIACRTHFEYTKKNQENGRKSRKTVDPATLGRINMLMCSKIHSLNQCTGD